jgi:hypothetical protein
VQKIELSEHFRSLARSLTDKRVILFVGSGFSLNAEHRNPSLQNTMQDWSGLVEGMVNRIWESQESVPGNITFPEIIQRYQDLYGKSERNRIIREAIAANEHKPGDLHRYLFNKSKWPWQAIVTTNIDNLIEQTFGEFMQAYTAVVSSHDFPKIQGTPVIKIHGTFDDEKSWIFSEDEYLSFEHEKRGFVVKLQQLFLEFTCLFVGYSLNDPDFKRIYHWVGRELSDQNSSPRRNAYAFIKNPDPAMRKYWDAKSLVLIEEDDIRPLIDDLSCSRPELENSHQRFLFSCFDLLSHYGKPEPLHTVSVKKSGWQLQQSISDFFESRKAERLAELRNDREEIKRTLRLYAREQRTLNLSDSKDSFAILLYKYVECFKELQSEAIAGGIEKYYLLEVREFIFGLTDGDGFSDREFWGIIVALTSLARVDSTVRPSAGYFIAKYYEYIMETQSVSYVTSWNAREVLPLILRAKRNDKILAMLAPRKWLDLVVYAILSGYGIEESKLLIRIKRILKVKSLSPLQTQILDYRRCIASIYCGRFADIQRALEAREGTTAWSPFWRAFLWSVLGDFNRAASIYANTRDTLSLNHETRFLALQGLRLSSSISFHSTKEDSRRISELVEEIDFARTEARALKIQINRIDFISIHDSEQSKFFSIAFEGQNMRRKAATGTRFYNVGRRMAALDKVVNRYWLAGLPFTWFPGPGGVALIREELEAAREPVSSIIERIQLLDCIDDWKETKVRDRIRELAGSEGVKQWQELQASLLDRFEHCANYLREFTPKRIFAQASGPSGRMENLILLFDEIAEYLNSSSLNRLAQILADLITTAGLHNSETFCHRVSDFKYILGHCLRMLPESEFDQWLVSLSPNVVFGEGYFGGILFLDVLNNSLIWKKISTEFQEKTLQAIAEDKLDIHIVERLTPYIMLWPENIRQRFLSEYSRIYETYRAAEIERYEIRTNTKDSSHSLALRDQNRIVSRNDDHALKLEYARVLVEAETKEKNLADYLNMRADSYVASNVEGSMSSKFFRCLTDLVRWPTHKDRHERIMKKLSADIEYLLDPSRLKRFKGFLSIYHDVCEYLFKTQEYDLWLRVVVTAEIWDTGSRNPSDHESFRRWIEEESAKQTNGRKLYRAYQEQGAFLRKHIVFLYSDALRFASVITQQDIVFFETLWHSIDQTEEVFGAVLRIGLRILTGFPVSDNCVASQEVSFYLRTFNPQTDKYNPVPWYALQILLFIRMTRLYWVDTVFAEKMIHIYDNINDLSYPRKQPSYVRLSK